jgi:cytochrome c oxidase subunit IV
VGKGIQQNFCIHGHQGLRKYCQWGTLAGHLSLTSDLIFFWSIYGYFGLCFYPYICTFVICCSECIIQVFIRMYRERFLTAIDSTYDFILILKYHSYSYF